MKRTIAILLALILAANAVPSLAEGWICVNCGAECDGNFCGQCGAARIDAWVCSTCGQSNTQNFCTNCGAPKDTSWTCPSCGTKNEGNFCANCGTRKPGTAPMPVETPAPSPVPSVVANGKCGDNAYWKLYENGLVTFSGTGPMWNYECRKLQSTSPFFEYKGMIKQMNVDEGITTIGDFLCYEAGDLESVFLPTTLVSIGWRSFYYCSSMKNFAIPNGVREIGNQAFVHTGIESLYIPESIEKIGSFAFGSCTNLRSVVLAGNPKNAGDSGVISYFAGCEKLESITLYEGISTIPYRMFAECGSLREITIPASVRLIDSQAFSECNSLEKVRIMGSRIQMDMKAFHDCKCFITLTFLSPVESVEMIQSSYSDGSLADYLKKNNKIRWVEGIPGKAIEDFAKAIGAEFVAISGGSTTASALTATSTPDPASSSADLSYNLEEYTGKSLGEYLFESYANQKNQTKKPTPTPKPTVAPAEKSIEQQVAEALDSLTCFERARTDYLAVLGTMDIYGTDKQSHNSNACINLIDLTNLTVTLTGVASDGEWYNAIWLKPTEQQLLAAATLAAKNYDVCRQGLGKNSRYVIVIKTDEDNYAYIESSEDAKKLAEKLSNL